MPYFAALLTRQGQDWKGSEPDLDGVNDLDSLVDLLADSSAGKEPVLFLLEQEDEWFAIVRVDGTQAEPRVFVSDVATAATSKFGRILLPEIPDDGDADEGDPALPVDVGPDPEVLDDLGMASDELVDLCSDGLLPADALTVVAERTGCVDALESLR